MRSIFAFIVALTVFAPQLGAAKPEVEKTEGQIKVAMRMIGHQVLLQSGDSTSRVLPVEKVEDRFHISFESAFAFDPEELATIVDSVMKSTGLSKHYLVEVESCESDLVVYSYEVGKPDSTDIVPCRARRQPESCYGLFITLFNDGVPENFATGATSDKSDSMASSTPLWIIAVFLLLGLLIWLWNKSRKRKSDPDTIIIGDFQFDPRGMTLRFKEETIVLTGKESELLLLLYSSANNTVEREMILKEVWGDDGDYIGRTLDVFISKLRKKLEADSRVKILNIRGVGYKLVYSLA